MKQTFSKRGVTLTELLITVSLVGLIFLAAVVIQQTADKFYQSTSAKSSIQTNAGYAMEKIVRSIRESRLAQITAEDSLTLTNQDGSTVTYGLKDIGSGNKGIYCLSDDGEEVLAKNVILLKFSPVGSSIEINLKLEDKRDKTKIIELSSSAAPRNP